MTDWRLTIVCLLLSPGDLQPISFAGPQQWDAYYSVVADLELLKPGYVAPGIPYSLTSEIGWCRENLADVATCPSIGHASRLPAHDYCRAMAVQSLDYVNWIEVQQLTYPHRDYYAVKQSATATQRQWEAMSGAANPEWHWAHRRQALRDLMEIIGPKRFYGGEW